MQVVIDEQQAVNGPAGPAPVRPPRSIRRTSSIDAVFAGGWGSPLELRGRARDAVTIDPAAAPVDVAAAATTVAIGLDRRIEAISVDPERHGIEQLVGHRGGGHLRAALDEVLPGERQAGTPLYLLLDDVSGTSLIAGFSLMTRPQLWTGDRPEPPDMEGVCIGFAPGSSALTERPLQNRHPRVRAVPSLVNPADPGGWHAFAVPDEGIDPAIASMRRSRRIDIWRDGDTLVIDAAFQDSTPDPDHGRIAIHEYLLRATAAAATMRLTSVEPDPRILPFRECPAAVATSQVLVGTPLGELRSAVLAHLARTNGCTHLNDALRALAEVPVLLTRLDEHTLG